MIMASLIRLQKYLADCGIASRRKAEQLITSGVITVNGEVITKLGTKVDPATDKVLVNGKPAKLEEKKIYIKLNKPRGVISSCYQSGETTILDLVKDIPYRLYPVGRLDKNSEGLIILTNDGELANQLMHPRFGHEKEYEVVAKNPLTAVELKAMARGIMIEGHKTLPAKVFIKDPQRFNIILKEGKKRQIRQMVEAIGNRVASLKRIRINNIKLGTLKPGEYALLKENEIKSLCYN